MKFELLDKWLDDWKIARIQYLDKLHDAFITWNIASSKAFNNHSVRREIEIVDYNPSKGRHTKTVKAVPVVIDGKEYLDYRGSGEKEYFHDLGLKGVTQLDAQLARYYSKEERTKRVEKDAEGKKKNIISRVQKICTEEVTEVAEVPGDGLFIRGANGKVAHMWAVFAGGYNIQCLHIRVLVKEAKWFN